MNRVSTSPHRLDPANLLLFMTSFRLLGAFVAVGGTVNRLAKRPPVNAAAVFFSLLLLFASTHCFGVSR